MSASPGVAQGPARLVFNPDDIGDVEDCLARRQRTLLHLMDNEPWDFFQCHIMETDRLYHFSWEQYETDDPTYAPHFYDTIHQIDDLLGEVLQRVERTDVMAELNNQYVFEVDLRASKPEIRDAIEEIFDVEVANVRTMVMPGKSRRWGRHT